MARPSRYSHAIELTLFLWHMPDDATEGVVEQSSSLQPSINLHAPVTALFCAFEPINYFFIPLGFFVLILITLHHYNTTIEMEKWCNLVFQFHRAFFSEREF